MDDAQEREELERIADELYRLHHDLNELGRHRAAETLAIVRAGLHVEVAQLEGAAESASAVTDARHASVEGRP